jgi:hypothetical protein
MAAAPEFENQNILIDVRDGIVISPSYRPNAKIYTHNEMRDTPYSGPFLVGTGHQAIAVPPFLGDLQINIGLPKGKNIRPEFVLKGANSLDVLEGELEWLSINSGVYKRLLSTSTWNEKHWEFRDAREVPHFLTNYVDLQGHENFGIPLVSEGDEAVFPTKGEGLFSLLIGRPNGDHWDTKYQYNVCTGGAAIALYVDLATIANANNLVAEVNRQNGISGVRFSKGQEIASSC